MRASSTAIVTHFVVSYLFVVDSRKCVYNLKTSQTTSTSISLAWDYECSQKNVTLVLGYQHVKFLACDRLLRDTRDWSPGPGQGQVVFTSANGSSGSQHQQPVVIKNLHPFSLYSLSLSLSHADSGRDETSSVDAETRDSLPQVAPSNSSISYDYQTTSDYVKFVWRNPLWSDCRRYNSHLAGYHFTLLGTDEWSRHIRREGNIDNIRRTKMEFSDLAPFSTYYLFLYVTRDGGEYNHEVYLRLEKTTLPGIPHTPRQLRVKSAYAGAFHLVWKPPYPPTGK